MSKTAIASLGVREALDLDPVALLVASEDELSDALTGSYLHRLLR